MTDLLPRRIRTIRDELSEMRALLEQIRDAQFDTAERLRQLQADITMVTRVVLADATAGRPDVGSESRRERHDVWKQFDLLTTRQVMGVINAVLKRTGGTTDRRAKAVLIGELVRGLFPPDENQVIDLSDLADFVPPERLAALAADAAGIRTGAAKLDMNWCWDYRADRFEQWPHSSGDSMPQFVVLPAWVAGDELIEPGRVFVV